MHSIEHIRRIFRHGAWANGELMATFGKIEDPPRRALERFAHILASERTWLARLSRSESTGDLWPEPTVEACRAQLDDLRDRWKAYLDTLTPEHLDASIAYTNQRGESWTHTVRDVLTHVALHSSYHRGQVAADLGASGHAPAVTDFIIAVRHGHLD